MVFVVGGRGFVGSAFVRYCEREGLAHEIVEIDNYDTFRGRSCEILINANGNSKKFLANEAPLREFDASVRTVVDTLHSIRYGKYVLCSTCDVYENCADPAQNHEGVAIDPARQSRYGFHKYVAEQFVRYEARDHLIVRFGGFVGPNLRKNPIFDILHGGPLWLDPGSELQYLHTDDAAAAVWKLIGAGLRNETVNLCGEGLVRLRDVMARAGRTVPVQPNSPRVRYHINIEKARRFCEIPASRETVFAYVDAQRGAAAGEGA